jgi:hypothetical protein
MSQYTETGGRGPAPSVSIEYVPLPPVTAWQPTREKGSSVAPLQLSSIALQRSVAGTVSPGQVAPHEPATQVCVPGRQMPTPEVPAGPV